MGKNKAFKLIMESVMVMAFAFMASGCQPPKSRVHDGRLIIFHAGSLAVPFKEIIKKFEQENPGIKVYAEGAGSRESARKISSLHKPCDIIASADYTVIEDLLIPEYADWYIHFAGNEMCIAFTEESRLGSEITPGNWFEILLSDTVAYGRSDPETDPCGYRSVIVMKLAEIYYDRPGLSNQLQTKNKSYIRPKEVDLLALLESHAIDYIFIYKSIALQHGLRYILLPDEINLKTPEFAHFYAKASVSVSGKNNGEQITKTGEPMVYAASIIKNCENFNNALKFMEFLLSSEKGLAIMQANGQNPAVGTEPHYMKKIPESLQKYLYHKNEK
ncbi:MAG: substrate-binding domain-containing protein [Bacteroidales bacterium]|nr:substrate-binding domain-containing protein [Bacteroidales bacterium]